MDGRGNAFNPNVYPDVPLYNIQAVATATGVPAITLRSWERRYGVPRPKRDAKGYRLYSERDVATTQWLRERVERGIGISRAVNMLGLLDSGNTDPDAHGTFDFESLQGRMLEALQRMDEDAVSRVVAEALMVASVEDVSLLLLQPVLYEIGNRWATGTMSVTTEHVGSNLLRAHLAQLIRLSPPAHRAGLIMVGCAPGEMHDIGALMLALFLRRRGYDVVYAGASLELESLARDALRLKPAAVCLSASSASTAQNLQGAFERLRADGVDLLAFGGKIFNENPELSSHIDGIFLGIDAAMATDTLELALTSSGGDTRNDHDI